MPPASWTIVTTLAVLVLASGRMSSREALGYFEASGDIGNPAISGSTAYDAQSPDLHDGRRRAPTCGPRATSSSSRGAR